MLKLRNQKGNFEIAVPTSLKEVKFDDLNELTKAVELSEHFAIIAITQAISPLNLALVAKNPEKDVMTSVSVHFLRANDPKEKIHAKTGDKVITTRSDLERAIHLSVPCGISMDSVCSCIEEDSKVRTQMTQGIIDEKGEYVKQIITVSFKIIPLTSIYATIDRGVIVKDAYKTTISGS